MSVESVSNLAQIFFLFKSSAKANRNEKCKSGVFHPHAGAHARFKSMKFEWDERKNQGNLNKHGFDFIDASRIFEQPMIIDLDVRENYGEDRYVGIGLLDGRVVVVIYTEPNDETVRVISLRKALSYERRRYEQYLKNRLV